MPEMLASYVAGEWYSAPDEGTMVVDAATGDAEYQIGRAHV